MDRYGDDQLRDILAARVRWGLAPDAVTDTQLARIADAAAGDARLAIGILRTAAGAADRENAAHITDAHIADAATDARAEIRQRNLDALTPHQRVVYDIVAEAGPLGPAEIHDRYTDAVDDPRTKRTVRSYLSKMAQYNLLTAEGQTQDRTYAVVRGADAGE